MHSIQLSKPSAKFLKKLPTKQIRQIKTTIQRLIDHPHPQDSKKLIRYEGYRRIDTGEYRIIYQCQKNILMITLIGKRNDGDVYKKMKRLL